MNINLSEITWDTVENINRGLCKHGRAAFGRNESGYTKAKDLWHNRQAQCSLLEILQLAHQCHRLAPFLNYNGNTFVTVVRTAIEPQPQIPRVKLNALRSLAGHYVAGTITHEEKQTLLMLLNSASSPLKVGDTVQTLKGTVRGVVAEILPDGNVLYKSTQGIILKTSPDALVKPPVEQI